MLVSSIKPRDSKLSDFFSDNEEEEEGDRE
jgi:hypothetical protein